MTKKILVLLILLSTVGAILYHAKRVATPPAPLHAEIAHVLYLCDGIKTIDARYYEGPPTPVAEPGQPPKPGGRVDLELGDERHISLPQTISGSGIRYASDDDSIVFFSKGNGANMSEHDRATYSGCVKVTPDQGATPNAYASSTLGFSLRFPAGYKANDRYVYDGFGPARPIHGVSFTIAPAIATGTNLSLDTRLSVETLPGQETCSADLFLYQERSASMIVDGDTTYSVASSTDAGAGNRYEQVVYAIPETHPCIAVRYFIHYSAFENYPPGMVKEFDHTALVAAFDAMRKTLVLLP